MPDISSTDDKRKSAKGAIRSSRGGEQKPSSQSTDKKPVTKKVPDPKSNDRKRARVSSSRSSSSSSSGSSDSSSSSSSASSASHSPVLKTGKAKVANTKSSIPDSRGDAVSRTTDKNMSKSQTQSKAPASQSAKTTHSHKTASNSLPTKDRPTAEIVEPPKSKPKVVENASVSNVIDSASTDRYSKKQTELAPAAKVNSSVLGNSTKKGLASDAFILPEFTRVMISKLTRNVTEAHISEIFSTWGKLVSVEMPMDHIHPEFGRGYAYVEYASPAAASDAVNYMNGGQLDGQEVSVTEVMPRFTKQSTTPPRPLRTKSPVKSGVESREINSAKDRSGPIKSGRNHEVHNSSTAPARPLESDRSRDRDRAREQERQREKDREQRIRDRDRAGKAAVAQRTSPSGRDRERARGTEKDAKSRDRDRRGTSDRDHNRSRGNRRDSSGSPFASRSGRQRSPAASHYRRPSPPPRGGATAESRRIRSRSPVSKSGRSAAVGKKPTNRPEPKATVTSSEAPRGKKTSTRSSSSSSNSSSSSSSSGSSSGSSSSSSSSSS